MVSFVWLQEIENRPLNNRIQAALEKAPYRLRSCLVRLWRITAVKAAKLDPVRADDLSRPGVIVSDQWEMIQEAKLLLAKLTTRNANVFYELGLAAGEG